MACHDEVYRRAILITFFVVCLALFFSGGTAQAQITSLNDTTSTPIEGAGHDYIHMLSETVNPANGSVSMRIQVPVPKGRGLTIPFSFDYDSGSVHHLNGAEWFSNSSYLAQGGWSYSVPTISATYTDVQVLAGYGNGSAWPPELITYDCPTYSNYMFQDAAGGQHTLGLATQQGNGANAACPSSGASISEGGDGQVYAWLPPTHPDPTWNPSATPFLPVTVSTADGTIYNFPAFNAGVVGPDNNEYVGVPNSIEDRNGNFVSVSGVQNGQFTFTDSAGRAVLHSDGFGTSGTTISVLGQVYTINWTTVAANFPPIFRWIPPFPEHPASDQYGCNPIGGVNDNSKVISSIVLPNGQQYQFHYGSDNSDPTFQNPYGLLNEIDYPSGAWVKYKWTMGNLNQFGDYPGLTNTDCPGTETYCPKPVPDGCLIQYAAPVVAERDMGTAIGAQPVEKQIFTLTTTWGADGTDASTQWASKVTTEQTIDNVTGKSTTNTYSYSPVNAPQDPIFHTTYWSQIPVEKQVAYTNYDGSFLREEDKTWYDQFNLKSDATTLKNGLTSETTYVYSTAQRLSQGQPSPTHISQLIEKDEYGFGQGSPVRKSLTNYASITTPIGGVVADAPSSVIVQDGNGNLVAETDYNYDQTATASVSAVQHDETNFPAGGQVRGNLTTKTEKCFTSSGTCQNATIAYGYDETGQITFITDPNGNQTQYSYADANNTNAYLTQVTRPQTNGINHIENFTYDFTSGQLLTAKDENGLTTSYQYNDPFFRPTEIDAPDGGKTTIAYNDIPPNPSVTTTELVTSGLPMTHTTVMDGLGRVTQTQLNTDPEGATYVDTTYDGMGNRHTVSNPYRSTGDPTYGITTYDHDAAGRVLQVTDADGSVATTSYDETCSANGPASQTTTTDEAGRMRASCTDALGRLVEVDEPGEGGNAASPGTGTANIKSVNSDGSDQSIQVVTAPAVAASGSVEINGTVQWKAVSSSATTGGTTTIAINGAEQQVPTGEVPGSGSVTINGGEQARKLVHAQTPGMGNITISGSEQSTTLQTYAGTPGKATITLGGDEQSFDDCAHQGYGNCPVYDTGRISVTAGPCAINYYYGQSDDLDTVAQGLASKLNCGSLTATSDGWGGHVYVTASSNGAGTNYGVSVSSTDTFSGWQDPAYSPYFYNPSFFVSGSNLTGGSDPQYQTVNDTGTITLTIGGHADSASYASGSSTSTIAAALVNAINGDSNALVSASNPSGSTIDFTARGAGSGTNYSVSCSSNTTNGNFSSASFSCSPTSTTLAGGTDNQYVYDSGTVSITVDGHTDSVNWSQNQNSSASSLALSLVNTINADHGAAVTASVPQNGTVITLTGTTPGSISDYPMSVGVTYDSGDFSQSSYSANPSGATLTGGMPIAHFWNQGTMTINVNGQNYTVNWGESDNPGSIAQNLYSAVSSSPSVSATLSGATVVINPSTPGASYSFSTSNTYDTLDFSSSSFNTANSVSDYGNATITVAGHSDSVPWSGSVNSNAKSIANVLASKINGDGSAPVTAAVIVVTDPIDAKVTLTEKTAGAAGNSDSLSSSPGYDSAHFSAGQSFISSSGPSLAKGLNPTYNTVYDSGTVALTVGNYTDTVAYGSGSSAGSVASALATQLNDPNNGNSPVTAVVSGSGQSYSLTLKARQPGATTNYALSWNSSSGQSSQFSSPSFSVDLQGASALSGGKDDELDLNAPSVTLYTYDILGNMTCAVQKGQDTNQFTSCASASPTWRPRSFSYNSLSQLLTATNPESGTIQYTYDADGNLTNKTDARGITTSYLYDALNRVISKNYPNDSTGTIGATYGYDGVTPSGCGTAPPSLGDTYPVGSRTAMCDGMGATSWSHDQMGRVAEILRTTNIPGYGEMTNPIAYVYNLDGSLAAMMYPSGRTVLYTPGGAGRPLAASSDDGINIATNVHYTPFGALASMQQGSSISISDSYSHRMEPVLISAQGNANTIYNLGYDFHYGNGDNGTVHQVVNYKDDNRTQNFTFDALNRIQTAYTNGPNWGEQFSIDTWGNMTERDPVGDKQMYEPLSVGQATAQNQFSTSSGFGYDADGNMTKNGGELYTYDAEDRLVTSDGYTYSYDGDGNRVLKLNSSGDGILYTYGMSGTPVREDTPSDGWEYMFFNGERVARANNTGALGFYMHDHLGSLGVVADASGNILQESDYYPYGGEMVISGGNGSGADNYKFTGKERDNESGLDNFGARYDSSALGRFMTPDWAARATAVPYAVYGDPQSLNLYGYVRNDPVSNVDADGHDCTAYNLVGASGQGTCPSSEAQCNNPSGCSTIAQNNPNPKPTVENKAQQQNVPTSNHTFRTPDAAATAALDAVNKKSNRQGVEYGGRIVQLGKNKFKYTLAVTQGDPATVNVDNGGKEGSRIPAGSTNAGIYHTHPSVPGHDAYSFSYADVYSATHEGVPNYVERPDGSIMKFDYSQTSSPSMYDPNKQTILRSAQY